MSEVEVTMLPSRISRFSEVAPSVRRTIMKTVIATAPRNPALIARFQFSMRHLAGKAVPRSRPEGVHALRRGVLVGVPPVRGRFAGSRDLDRRRVDGVQ